MQRLLLGDGRAFVNVSPTFANISNRITNVEFIAVSPTFAHSMLCVRAFPNTCKEIMSSNRDHPTKVHFVSLDKNVCHQNDRDLAQYPTTFFRIYLETYFEHNK